MGRCRLALILLLLASPLLSRAQFCLLQPLYPPCCPSPCPIDDQTRDLTLAQAQLTAASLLSREQDLARWAGQVLQGLGAGGPSLRPVTPPLPVADDLPPVAGQPTSPVALANWVKQRLFDPAGTLTSSTETSLNQARLAVARQENAASLAMSLATAQALSSSVTPKLSPVSTVAAPVSDLRADLDADSGARLTVLSDLTTLQQILAQWTAARAGASALAHRTTAGLWPAAASPAAAPAPPAASPASSAPNFDGLASVSLQQQIPALQQTRARAALAAGFAQSAAASARQDLAPWVADPAGAWPEITSALRRLDKTLWTDSAAKATAAQGASGVLAALLVPATQPATDRAAVQQSLGRWLESDKQSRYWQSLDADAVNSLSAVQVRLAQLQRRSAITADGH